MRARRKLPNNIAHAAAASGLQTAGAVDLDQGRRAAFVLL